MFVLVTIYRLRRAASAKTEFDYLFAENGLDAFKNGELLAVQSLKAALGEDNLKVGTFVFIKIE